MIQRLTTLLVLIQLPIVALADHVSGHLCNWSIDGYVTNRYSQTTEGWINDTQTGLQWQKCSLGMQWFGDQSSCLGYQQSEDWKQTLNSVDLFNQQEIEAGRQGGWRLPNIKELASIVNMHCAWPAIDVDVFPQSLSSYWSSTPYTGGTVKQLVDTILIDEYAAWSINFNSGREERSPVTLKLNARLVRDIPNE